MLNIRGQIEKKPKLRLKYGGKNSQRAYIREMRSWRSQYRSRVRSVYMYSSCYFFNFCFCCCFFVPFLFCFVVLFCFFCEAMYSRLLKVEPVMVIKWEYNFKAWFPCRCICRACRTKKIHRTDKIHSFSYNKLYLSFLLYWAFVREVSIKLYLSYEFFSYDRYDRYNDMETRLKANWKNAKSKLDTSYPSPLVWPSPFGTIWVHEEIKRFITVLIFLSRANKKWGRY